MNRWVIRFFQILVLALSGERHPFPGEGQSRKNEGMAEGEEIKQPLMVAVWPGMGNVVLIFLSGMQRILTLRSFLD